MLEYNSNIWSPKQVNLIDLLDSVQRGFTKRVKAISQFPYLEHLTMFDLEPLELRRLHYDIIQYYEILNNLTSLNPADYFKLHFPFASARDPSRMLLLNQLNSLRVYCLDVFSIDILIAGTVYHQMFAIVILWHYLKLLFVRSIFLPFLFQKIIVCIFYFDFIESFQYVLLF